jgi:hypothetical protein
MISQYKSFQKDGQFTTDSHFKPYEANRQIRVKIRYATEMEGHSQVALPLADGFALLGP